MEFYTKRYISHPDYHPPSRFNQWENHDVGSYFAEEGSDGHNTKIFEQRTPATFWSVLVEPNKTSPGYVIYFGSGDENGYLAFRLAELIANGSVEIELQIK